MNRNYSKLLTLGLGAVSLASAALAQAPSKGPNPMNAPLAQQAMAFRENRGQWDGQARYLAQFPGLDYWVTSDGIVVDQYKFGTTQKPPNTGEAYDKVAALEQIERKGNIVRMRFVGANPTPASQAYGAKPGVMDYFLGQNHMARGVKSYAEAYLSSIYSGVHVRHYVKNGAVRYDILVDPGHDPHQVEMSFDGADSIAVNQGSQLKLGTSVGALNFADLHVYQPVGNTNRAVPARFVVTANKTVKVDVGSYDPRLPLVIDPAVFGSYVGSEGTDTQNADEVVTAITAESNGNLYMTGVTSSPTFPISAGPYDKYNVDGLDAFLCQLDGNAYTVTYSAVLGGSGDDYGMGIGFDETTRTLWVGGSTNSTDFAGADNAKVPANSVWMSKFIFASGGVQPQYSHYVNEPGNVTPANFRSIKVSKTNRVYVLGESTVTTLTGNGFTNYLSNNSVGAKKAGWVIGYDSDLNVLYKTMVGGKVDVVQYNGAVNKDDYLTLVGYIDATTVEDTGAAADPTFTTTDGVFSGVTGVFQGGRWIQNRTCYVVQLDPTGVGHWACTLGGAGKDDARAVAYDNEDNVYVTGFTASFNFQRTPGAFQQDLGLPQVYVTKLSADASEIAYSTGLRTSGNVWPTCISVDGRDNCYVGGVCGFTITSPFPGLYIPTIPGSITTTDRANGDPETAIDPDYNGGDQSVDATNTGAPDSNVPSTTDGFVTVLNPAGSALQYSSYVGEDSDDRVNDIFVDSVGGCWVAGYSQVVWNNFVTTIAFSVNNGIGAHITPNAFKTSMPLGGPGPSQPNYGASNGWVFKLRVVLPRMSGLSVNPTNIAGGYGATSTVTVSLEDPAPAGGVNMTLTTSNATATSWDPNTSVLSLPITVPEGATSTTATIYSLPVTSNQVTSIKAILDNDYKETRLTVLPWLSDMSVTPLVTEGGNDLIVRVNLSDVAPASGVPVLLSTDKPEIINLPQPPQVLVPQNAKNAQITVSTNGVTAQTTATITASFLGVSKSKLITFNPATIKDFTFNPSEVNRGDDSTATVRFNGKTGAARNITISQVSGDAGALVNGQALPVVLSVPAGVSSTSFTVTAPLTITSGFTTLKATDGTTSANGTLSIDQIDILDVVLTPSTDVQGGQIITGQVTLTRPAGPSGLTISIVNTNAAAGTLSSPTVTVGPGQTSSSSFTFQTNVVPVDTHTNIHAKKTGYSDKYRAVTVRGNSLTLSLNPSTVIGSAVNPTGTITLSKAAPQGGMKVTVSSSNTAAGYVSSSVVTVPEFTKTAQFTVFTRNTPVQRTTTISAIASSKVKDSKLLTVNPPAITGLVLSPDSVLGGSYSKGTITFSQKVPSGTVVTLTSSDPSLATVPATLAVTSGLSQYNFSIKTYATSVTSPVTITAALAPTSKQATLVVRAPGIGSVSFNPSRVTGGKSSVGTVTLEGPAPSGGLVVTITSSDPNFAHVVGSSQITIPAGKLSGNFNVATSQVSRTIAVQFTAESSLGVGSGYLYIDP